MACPVSGHSGKWEEGRYEGTQHATSAPGGQIRCRRKHLMKMRVWRLVYLKLWTACTPWKDLQNSSAHMLHSEWCWGKDQEHAEAHGTVGEVPTATTHILFYGWLYKGR